MEGMLLSDYDYYLPENLIAQDPLTDRTSSRLLVLDKSTGSLVHDRFFNIGKYLNKNDCLVINNTKVIPARLLGKRPTGGAVEVLLLKRRSLNLWETLVKPGKNMRIGDWAIFGDGRLSALVEEILDDGLRLVRFEFDGVFEEILEDLGKMPLPPYITHELLDKNRYQTVYAKDPGSAAAPTAGLHFTNELLASLLNQGTTIAEITLHVGLGTFRPVKEENILDHKMHSEHFEITPEAAGKINAAKSAGGRVIAVGTTSVRTLESVAAKGPLGPSLGDTDIFIYPGFEFKAVDAIITNFHLPKSTLLMLISAFAGRDKILAAYEEAVKEKYRFFSFGDAMLIV